MSSRIRFWATAALIAALSMHLANFVERSAFTWLLTDYLLICIFTWLLLKQASGNQQWLLAVSILVRLCLITALPWLSQDYFRFIWDGRMIAEGWNPYLYLPKELILQKTFSLPQADVLYRSMGDLSAGNYTNYPPLNQFLFWAGAVIGKPSLTGAVVCYRIIIILADIGIWFYGRKVLQLLGMDTNRIFWYMLNPLVVIELTGNLHFEGVMLFFLVLGLYWVLSGHIRWAAGAVGLSVATKLVPLLVLPVWFHYLGWRKSAVFYTIIIALNILLFLPFISPQLFQYYSQSIDLWFTKFEFNASLYYLIREAGYYIKGYNIIQITGRIMPVLMVLFIVYTGLYQRKDTITKVLNAMLLLLTVYFLQSTTVHPWYIVSLVLLAVFTPFRYPYLWSATVILSYFAYAVPAFRENPWLLWMEYLPVYAMAGWEWWRLKKCCRLVNRIFLPPRR